MKERSTRHLDLGCGDRPRNPYQCDELFGVDVKPILESSQINLRRANLVTESIPFPENYFDSVSAYDFLEHIPRIFPHTEGTRLPFIELMNEIWRVLMPGGRFYGYTPVYPHPAAFQDPTHVNILTRNSHVYFTRPALMARMYGYIGDFSVIRIVPARGGEFDYEPTARPNLLRRLRLRHREWRGRITHLVWEFEAHKSP